MQVQNLIPFMVSLPDDINQSDTVCLELFGEAGVADTAVFSDELNPSELLKVFVHKLDNGYRFSVISQSTAMNGIELETGETKLRTWRGNSDTEVFAVGDPLAGFSSDGTVSYMRPRGDDLSLRVAIKRSSEQAEALKP